MWGQIFFGKLMVRGGEGVLNWALISEQAKGEGGVSHAFPSNLNTVNLKVFPAMVRYLLQNKVLTIL